MKASRLSFILALMLLFFASTFAEESKPTINLIYKQNLFGLARDAKILHDALKNLGYSVRSFKIKSSKPVRKADINLFLEDVNPDLFSVAQKNYFIPNPEWYYKELSIISKLDMILCKTHEAVRIFKQYHPDTIFLGFTSIDRFDSKVKKNYQQALHTAGGSYQKGTDNIIKAWEIDPKLPGITIYRQQGRCDYLPLYNVQLFCCFVPDEELIKLQNSYGLHLCPSETEGFGHYIMEALSCEAIPITTNAPPMNEIVIDKRCLARYTHTSEQRLAINYYVDPIDLGKVVANLMLLSEEELINIGKNNRQIYLDNKGRFEKRMREIFAPKQKKKPTS